MLMRVSLVCGLISLSGTAWADESKPMSGEKMCPALVAMCPVGGEKIDPKVSAESKSWGTVYFCCKKCIAKFEASPDKYADKVMAQKIAMSPHRKQILCPSCDKAVGNKKVTVDHHGQKIAFCCQGCADKFAKDPKAYNDALAKCFTIQEKCPVSDEPIDPDASMKLKDGRMVYFCCPKCAKKFEADEATFVKKVDAMMAEATAKK